MTHDETDDLFDYSMSNFFVSQARQRPYAIGFRPRRHPRRQAGVGGYA